MIFLLLSAVSTCVYMVDLIELVVAFVRAYSV